MTKRWYVLNIGLNASPNYPDRDLFPPDRIRILAVQWLVARFENLVIEHHPEGEEPTLVVGLYSSLGDAKMDECLMALAYLGRQDSVAVYEPSVPTSGWLVGPYGEPWGFNGALFRPLGRFKRRSGVPERSVLQKRLAGPWDGLLAPPQAVAQTTAGPISRYQVVGAETEYGLRYVVRDMTTGKVAARPDGFRMLHNSAATAGITASRCDYTNGTNVRWV